MRLVRRFSGAGGRIAVASVCAGVLALGATVVAQIPGRNVNMVSGVTLPDGDPFLQRQNEPSMAASTRNPLHLLAGSNDYRTIDLPMPADGGQETGDAWLGKYVSPDGGQRWTSTLLPGYPQEPESEGRDPQGRKSPLKAGPAGQYGAAADPVVRAGTHGLFYFGGLAFDREPNGKSAIFMARYIDNNNREDRDAIAYLGTSMVATASGTDTTFLDKPWVAVDVPRGTNPSMCRIETPGEARGALPPEPNVVQNIPAGTVYVAYASFSGPETDRRSAILLSRSFDCGQTWQTPIQISDAEDAHNQGVSLAIDPRNGDLYAAWRRFSPAAESAPGIDAMMLAKLPVNGRKFDPPGVARRFPKGNKHGLNPERFADKATLTKVDDVAEFDQVANEFKFRTNAYPAMTIDGDGRVYLAWSERGFAKFRTSAISGDARIVLVSTTDATTFTEPAAIDNDPSPSTDATPVVSDLVGHQVMPSMTFAGGKLLVAYYDVRETVTQAFGPLISDKPSDGDARQWNTIDLRAALGTPGINPQFAPSTKVSQYLMGYRNSSSPLEQMQYNPANLPMFRQGTAAFLGDYIDLTAAPAFVSVPDKDKTKDKKNQQDTWIFNTAPSATLPIFHAVWTDNRDVRFPQVDSDGNGNPWNDYGPPINPDLTNQVCVGGNAGSRNQNIYTARITGGLQVGSPSNSKQLLPDVQRGFVVFAQNATSQTRSFRMTVLDQPVGGRASFNQFPLPPFTAASAPPLASIDLSVPPRSTAARTVYVSSTDPHAQVIVDVSEIAGVGGVEVPGGLDGTVVLNPDRENPELENPELENPELENVDIANQELHNPELENPELENPELENPELENPELENPELENIVVGNPELENPELENPELENPELENPELENTGLGDQGYGANRPGVVTDITWTLDNQGNTTSAFNVNLFLAQADIPAGIRTQLILHKVYRTPVVKPGTCDLKFESRNVVVANIPSPDFVLASEAGIPDQNDPSAKNATMFLAPGETGKITLRVLDADKSNNVIVDGASIDVTLNPQSAITPGVSAQAVGTVAAITGEIEPPVVTPSGSNLVFVGQPTDVVSGALIVPAIIVKVFDNSGAVIPGAVVTLSLAPHDGPGVLSGALTAVADAFGNARFPGVTMTGVGTGYRIMATATFAGYAGATGLSAPFNVGAAAPPVTASGQITDPSGDSDGTADLVSASVTVSGGEAHLRVRFAPGTFDPAMTAIQFLFDTDQNPATGHQGSNAGCVSDNGIIGVEYLASFGSTFYGNTATLSRHTTGCNNFASAGTAGQVSFVADGADISIPLSLLGGDDGNMAFKVTSSRHLGNGGFTGVLDTMSNIGQPAAQVGPPSGQVNDPSGDSGGTDDLVSASVTISGSDARLSVRFAPGTFDPAATHIQFLFDADQNPATGHAGSDGGCVADNGIIGVEHLVDFGSAFYGTAATVSRHTSGCNGFASSGSASPVTFVADGADVTIPLSLLGGDDGNMAFKVVSSRYLGNNAFSGVLDRMSNAGQPATQVAPPPPIQVVGPVGGSGGSAFGPVDCDQGSVVVGLSGRAGQDIDQTSLLCAPLSAGGIGSPTTRIFVAGGNTGTDYGATLTCGSGEAMTGVFGDIRALGTGVIDRLGVHCTNVATGATSPRGPVGANDTIDPFTLSCPGLSKVVGLQGRQGLLMDQIAIRCQ